MKSIRSQADLAINGAPLAFAEPLDVGRPNIGERAAFMQRIGQILDSDNFLAYYDIDLSTL